MNLVKSLVFAIGVFALMQFASAQPADPQPQDNVVNWEKAHAHAKDGKKVKLTIKEVSVEKNEGFDVYIKDGRKETLVGSVASVISPATVEMSITKGLAELRKAPSDKAKILLKAKAPRISMGSFRVDLLPEKE